MSVIDFNAVIFIVLFIVNIALCVKRVPIIGFVLGFFTLIICGLMFMNDSNIGFYLTMFLFVIGFSCMVINGIEGLKKK